MGEFNEVEPNPDEKDIFLKHALNAKNIFNNIVSPRPEDIAEIIAQY